MSRSWPCNRDRRSPDYLVRSTRARDAAGHWTLWALVALLGLIYAGNLLGPPPPDVVAIAWVGHAQWLLVAWGYWIDRHRETV